MKIDSILEGIFEDAEELVKDKDRAITYYRHLMRVYFWDYDEINRDFGAERMNLLIRMTEKIIDIATEKPRTLME